MSPLWQGFAWLAVVALVGCTDDVADVTLTVTLGHESDTLSRSPAVVRLDVSATSLSGDVRVMTSAAPGSTFDLGELPIDELLTFEASGVDAAGNVVVRGRSLGTSLAFAEGANLGLFVQRVGAWARPPEGLSAGHRAPASGAFVERYVLATGGTSADGSAATTMDYYDLGALGPANTAPVSFAARTVVVVGTLVLALGDANAAWLDITGGQELATTLPMPPAAIAGGRVLRDEEGTSYVVGATRAELESSDVLAIDATAAAGSHALVTARRGAAAAWVPGVGLAVVGGASSGAGVELLRPGATSFEARPFPTDATEGAGAAMVGTRLVVAGGHVAGAPANVRAYDVACLSDCSFEDTGLALPVALGETRAFALDAQRVIVVGDEISGASTTRAFVVDLAALTITESPLRETRRGARAEPAPNGTLFVVGGLDASDAPVLTVESFFP